MMQDKKVDFDEIEDIEDEIRDLIDSFRPSVWDPERWEAENE